MSTAATTLPLQQPIEPGLIPLFRRIILIIWGLSCLGILNAVLSIEKTPGQYGVILTWCFTGGLFLYLSNQSFMQRHPHMHLTLALGSISVVPIISEYVANGLYLLRGGSPNGPLINSAALYLWLILPLVLVSTQYGMRSMLLFTGGTSFLSLLLAYGGRQYLGITPDAALGNAFVRLIIFSFVGFIVTRLSQSQRALRQELVAKNQQIAEYASRLEELAIVRERNRMARELHDTLAHTLSAVEVQLKVLDMMIQQNPADARTQLREIHTLTRSGLREARRALHDLRARPIEEFGLLLALERLAERAADRTGADPVVVLPRTAPLLSTQQQQQLYRIVEEAFNNIVRHARAAHFWLTMTVEQEQVCVTVKDDGVGFDADATPEARYGLKGMRERAGLVQSQLSVSSAPGRGTEVRLVLGVKR